MIDLVSFDQAKLHLRVIDSDHDIDIALKVSQASELVMNHYKHDTVPDDWITNSSPLTHAIPQWAQATTLLVLGELFENREAGVANVLSSPVKSLIPRDPTLA